MRGRRNRTTRASRTRSWSIGSPVPRRSPVPGHGACGVSHPHEGSVRLRLRRHGRDDPAGADVHPRPHVRPGPGACGDCATEMHRSSSGTGTWRPSPSPRTRCSTRPCSSHTRRDIVPAPESAHAVRGAIDEATAARDAGEERASSSGCRVTGRSTCRHDYLNGRLPEVEYRQEDVTASMASVPDVPPILVRRALHLRLVRPRRGRTPPRRASRPRATRA